MTAHQLRRRGFNAAPRHHGSTNQLASSSRRRPLAGRRAGGGRDSWPQPQGAAHPRQTSDISRNVAEAGAAQAHAGVPRSLPGCVGGGGELSRATVDTRHPPPGLTALPRGGLGASEVSVA